MDHVRVQNVTADKGGFAHVSNGTVHVSHLQCMDVHVATHGGVGYVEAGGHLLLQDGQVDRISALLDGGALHLSGGSTATVTDVVGVSYHAHERGGFAMLHGGSALTLVRSELRQLDSGAGGFAEVHEGSTVALVDSRVLGMTARADGGGLKLMTGSRLVGEGNATLENCSAPGGNGGAVWMDSSNITVQGVTIVRGSSLLGGGIFAAGTSAMLDHVHVHHSTATNGGGGVYATNAAVTVLDTSVVGGASSIGGGVCVTDQSTWTGLRFRVLASKAVRGGGVLVEKDSTMDLRESKITGNHATEGGGFCLRDGAHVSFRQGTEINHNAAENQGGGLMVISDSYAELYTTVMTANTAFYGAALFVDGCDVKMNRVHIVKNTVVGGGYGGGRWINHVSCC